MYSSGRGLRGIPLARILRSTDMVNSKNTKWLMESGDFLQSSEFQTTIVKIGTIFGRSFSNKKKRKIWARNQFIRIWVRFSKKRRLKEKNGRLLKWHLLPLTITIQREGTVLFLFLFCCIIYYHLGTRKHPKKQAVVRTKTSEGLTNPLQLVTSKAMFSASSFAELNISEKLVFVI